jgi:ferric-dicitrate binding protein FerR (iron transport regulator)
MGDDDLREPRRAWRTDEEWAKLQERIAIGDPGHASRFDQRRGRDARRRVFGAIAAIAACAAAVVLIVRGRVVELTADVIATAPGERRMVMLSDSSVVTLGPATTLRFAVSHGRRQATLNGLAEFRVAHDARHPFVVRTESSETTDIGTEFVVRAYASDSSARVAVLSGVVSLARIVRDSTVVNAVPAILRMGDVGIVRGRNPVVVSRAASAAEDSAWVSGTMSFDDATVQAVALDLGRWFGVDVHVDDAALAGRHVSAVYHDPVLADVLRALAAILDADYSQSGRVVHLRSKRK